MSPFATSGDGHSSKNAASPWLMCLMPRFPGRPAARWVGPCVDHRCIERFFADLWIVFDQIIQCLATLNATENGSACDARSPQNGLTAKDVRIDGEEISPRFEIVARPCPTLGDKRIKVEREPRSDLDLPEVGRLGCMNVLPNSSFGLFLQLHAADRVHRTSIDHGKCRNVRCDTFVHPWFELLPWNDAFLTIFLDSPLGHACEVCRLLDRQTWEFLAVHNHSPLGDR